MTATDTSATTGWDPAKLEASAGSPFTIKLDNQDSTVQHNLVVQNADGTAVAIQGDPAPFLGPAEREYQVPALTAGTYKYVCQVHPATMIGELTVE